MVLGGAPEALDRLGEGGGGGTADTARIAAALAEQQTAAAKAAAARAVKGKAPAGGAGPPGQEAEEVSPERLAEWRARAASALEDLRLDDRESAYLPLNIQDPRAYFDAGSAAAAAAAGTDGKPAPQQANGAAEEAQKGMAAGRARGLLAALAAVQPAALPNPPCDPALAEQVLLELCQDQDASLVREFGPAAAAALQYPPHDRAHGLPSMLIVRRPAFRVAAVRHARLLHDRSAGQRASRRLQVGARNGGAGACLAGPATGDAPPTGQAGTLQSAFPCPSPNAHPTQAPLTPHTPLGLPPHPQPLQEHFRGEALKANELLRHFWGNLPLVSAARAARADKLARALHEQRAVLVSHMRHPAGEGESTLRRSRWRLEGASGRAGRLSNFSNSAAAHGRLGPVHPARPGRQPPHPRFHAALAAAQAHPIRCTPR